MFVVNKYGKLIAEESTFVVAVYSDIIIIIGIGRRNRRVLQIVIYK